MQIIFQDNDLAVVSKPAGMVVNLTNTYGGPTVQAWWGEYLLAQMGLPIGENLPVGQKEWQNLWSKQKSSWQELLPEDFDDSYGSPEEIFFDRGGIVHRLDKETSGVLVLAKNPGSLVNLLAQFKQRQVQKRYKCLVHGKFRILDDIISVPLGRSTQQRIKFAADALGRVAETKYLVEEVFDLPNVAAKSSDPALKSQLPRHFEKRVAQVYQGFSLVSCWPKTGRTHQIRVHMNHIKHPVVADPLYLGKKRLELDLVWCPRMFLHAVEIAFAHPRTKEPLNFTAELDPDLQTALQTLRK